MDDHKQTFATSNLQIKKIDFSHNAIRRLSDKAFNGIQVKILGSYISSVLIEKKNRKLVLISKRCAKIEKKNVNFHIIIYCLSRFYQQDTLVELRLTDNLLGDSLNPIFSTVEFQALSNLQVVDLSGNKIKAIEEGILKGCTNLSVSLIDDFLIKPRHRKKPREPRK